MTLFNGPGLSRHFHRIAWAAVALALCVIVFGAFVRLSHAGLSCPDWPTCYGRATWPKAVGDVADHAASSIRAFDGNRAWREQVHRHLAATLGVLVLVLALLAARRRPRGAAQVVGAALLVGIAIPMYMHGEHALASVLAIAGEAVLLGAAWRWSNSDLSRVAVLTLATIIFQALLGMWTVTWLLKPIVVMGHLLGGMTTLGLLAWMAWRATDLPLRVVDADTLRAWLRGGLIVLAVQIALGGWTSANYAALACGIEFPKCLGQWWPPHDFREALVLWRGIGVDYEGGVLDAPARAAIQMMHRIFAIAVLAYMAVLVVKLLRVPGMRGWGMLLGLLTLTQLSLGIANVLLGLPLKVAVMHNGGAALLLLVLVTLLARLAPLARDD